MNIKEFKTEIELINEVISSFNEHLNQNLNVPVFDLDTAFEQKNIVEVLHKDWDGFPFPNNDTAGVYFILGHEKTKKNKTGMYIGKASLSSTTSHRLYAHLHPSRSDEYFSIDGYNEEVYIVDFIASIDLDKLAISFMSPSLEEYLITSLREKLNLINGTGNS